MNATLTMEQPKAGYPNSGIDNQVTSTTRPLWAAVGVLGVCVLAMGASLVHIQQRPAEPTAQALAAPMKSLFSLDPAQPPRRALQDSKLQNGNMITEMRDDEVQPKPLQSNKNTAQPAIKSVAKPPVKPLPAGASQSAKTGSAAQNATPAAPITGAAPVAQTPVCANCGTVVGVTPMTRQGQGSGAGAVAGGVVGAVLGNQVGQGNGRAAATILGAVGGGWAGNTIEKNVKKTTVYDVQVKMQDGSTRRVEQSTAPALGTKVSLEGNQLRGSDGAVLSQAPAQRAARNAPQQTTAVNTYGGSR